MYWLRDVTNFSTNIKLLTAVLILGQITKILLFGGKDFKPCICDTCCLLVTRNSHPRIYFICSFFYFFVSKVLELAFTKCVSLYMTTFIFSAAFIKLSLKILAR